MFSFDIEQIGSISDELPKCFSWLLSFIAAFEMGEEPMPKVIFHWKIYLNPSNQIQKKAQKHREYSME